MRKLHWRFFSPLSRNILIINLITLTIPALGFLYLSDYRRELVRAEIQSVHQESKIFADALAVGAVRQFSNGAEFVELPSALQILRRLSTPLESRAILFLNDGTLIADSRNLHNEVIPKTLSSPDSDMANTLESLEEYLHLGLNSIEDFIPPPLYREPAEMHIYAFPHALQAMAGEIASKVWSTPERDVVISVAVPVQPLKRVFGVLVLIRQSDHIETTIRELRWNILIAFLIAVAFTVTMSLLLAQQLTRPLSTLARAAQRFGQPQHKLNDLQIPILRSPDDEIGILSRALFGMTENLKARISTIEGFAADVAHEIRNPVSGISSALETYQTIKSKEKRQTLMTMAQTELRRIDIMIDDILESSRLDAALMAETPETVNIAHWLAKFGEMFHALNPDQELALEFPSQKIWVAIKPSRLDQVLQNILGNARDFQPRGVPIKISLNTDQGQAVLSIIDRGTGIPEQSLENIFNRFYSDRPSEQKSIHTGLGLSIVKQIIESYNGNIIAKNRNDKQSGAVFTITLPIIKA